MYNDWMIEPGKNGDIRKYFPLVGEKAIEVGVARRNGSSSPVYRFGDQIVGIRNFGMKKISVPKIQSLLSANEEITIIGGPCLFSSSQLGFFNLKNEFCSLATPRDREQVLEEGFRILKIGEAVTGYHQLHVSFMEKTIKLITEVTGKTPNIKLLVPTIEYMAYIPDAWNKQVRDEYWKKIDEGGAKVEDFYRKKLSVLGNLKIIRKRKWDVSSNGNGLPPDIASYMKSYTTDTGDGLVIAVEDFSELPLVIEAGKHLPWLIGILGILASPEKIFLKEEIHPYFL